MNETLRTIKTRRAIRNYKSEQIPDFELQEILSAALYAPNAMNKQNWHFTVIQNKVVLSQLTNTIIENILYFDNSALEKVISAPNYHPFYNAPTFIIISGNTDSEFIQIEAGAAAQNICLAAESLNIGSCIITKASLAFNSNKSDKLKETLGIPPGYNHICCVALGYRAGHIPPVPPRNAEVITYIR